MLKGFVFGKFYPFHKGHEAMIRFAKAQCDFLSVLVCCSEKEGIPCYKRKKWIEETFEEIEDIEVVIYEYLEEDLPNTSVSSRNVSELWAAAFKKIFPGHQLLITSEKYGEYVADYMHIQHIIFDPDRQKLPISATAIRRNPFRNWPFLPEAVKPHFALKVVLLGTESTGKSTLSKKLAQHFNATLVEEAGRELIPDSKVFGFKDLEIVAQEHSRRIHAAVKGENPVVIIDTDIHITKSYGRFMFGRELEVKNEIWENNKANLYLYLKNDVPHVQDGTRLDKDWRNRLDLAHRQILLEHEIEFVEIEGDWEERFQQAVDAIIDLMS